MIHNTFVAFRLPKRLLDRHISLEQSVKLSTFFKNKDLKLSVKSPIGHFLHFSQLIFQKNKKLVPNCSVLKRKTNYLDSILLSMFVGCGCATAYEYLNIHKSATSDKLVGLKWLNFLPKKNQKLYCQPVVTINNTKETKCYTKDNEKNDVYSSKDKKDGIHTLWRSKQSQPFDRKYNEAVIFSGNSNIPLANAIAECLGTSLGKICLNRFADGEVNLQYLESLRGKNVYLIQSTSPPVNEHLIELLLMVSTARRSSAKRITAVIPYYGYSRQDRKLHSRVPISAADVAKMVETMGVDRVISVDLHCGQIQGFFGPRVPVDNLEAQIIGLEYFAGKKLNNPVVVSPDAGGVYRARKFQEGLENRGIKNVGIAMLVKHRLHANTIERMDLVGKVDGCDVVIVDDMIDTAGTLCEAASQLVKHGARRVFAFATHGLFSGKALERIENSLIEEVVICNTIQQRQEISKSNRITCLNLAILIADVIRRIHQKESLEQLFGVPS